MMFRSVTAIGFVLGFGALAALGLYLYLGLALTKPILARTNLPMGSTVVRMKIDTNPINFSDFKPYEMVVETPFGSAASELWYDWGPAQRANLYRTSDDWLAVLGGGGFSVMFVVDDPSGPRLVPNRAQPATDGRDWIYLGAFDSIHSNGQKRLRWFSPNELKECLPTYGTGQYAYRKNYQDIEEGC